MLIASYSFLGTDLSVVISPVLSSSTIVAYDCCKQELYFMDVVFHNWRKNEEKVLLKKKEEEEAMLGDNYPDF